MTTTTETRIMAYATTGFHDRPQILIQEERYDESQGWNPLDPWACTTLHHAEMPADWAVAWRDPEDPDSEADGEVDIDALTAAIEAAGYRHIYPLDSPESGWVHVDPGEWVARVEAL